jgi:hypothetical protein
MDKNNSHKTMVQKEERRMRTIHTKQWYKKKRGMNKNNSHKTMVQKEERIVTTCAYKIFVVMGYRTGVTGRAGTAYLSKHLHSPRYFDWSSYCSVKFDVFSVCEVTPVL